MKGFLAHLAQFEVFLASRSPRRQQLLKDLGIPYEVWLEEEMLEEFDPDLSPGAIVRYLCELKSKPFRNKLKQGQILITADTIVCKGKEIMGKPVDAKEAKEMLNKLSASTHEVLSGVHVLSTEKSKTFVSKTKVHFKNIAKQDLNYYIDQYQPYDKAGAYGIQEWIGLVAVDYIEGSYFNVMGLPVQALYEELKTFTNYYRNSNDK